MITLLVARAVNYEFRCSFVMGHLKAASLDLVWPLVLVAGGVYSVVRPAGVLGWVSRAHPDLKQSDPNALLLVRVIGAGICAIGLVILFAFLS